MTLTIWRKYTEWPLLVAAIAFLVAYSVEVIDDLPERQAGVFEAITWVTWGLFVIDYVVKFALAPRKWRWFWRNFFELIILALPVLRPLRLLRLVLLVRILHRVAGNALRGRILTYVLGAAVLLVYVGALAILDAEQNDPAANIHSFGDALWWAVVTITTVGYGDYYPVTLIGRLVAAGMMIGGIAVLGVVTASLASWLIEQVGRKTAEDVEAADKPLRAEISRLADQVAMLSEQLERRRGESVDS